ncbi:MAG: CPBP family intramembrane metalloprotease [Chlamydiota bacterium]|nr:CPBP family intramembrane metalloprotease [Chlamydiota bacterium]
MKTLNSESCVFTGLLNKCFNKSIETVSLTVISLILVFPIIIILCLQWAGVTGLLGYNAYKIGFILPPLLYSRYHGISIRKDIIGWPFQRQNLIHGFVWALFFFTVFWSAFLLFGNWLIDKNFIVQQMNQQFLVNSLTICIIAPITIFFNSMLEEFFYRGFCFGLLLRHHKKFAYVLPAFVFTLQHALFIHMWFNGFVLSLVLISLFVFALILERLYASTKSLAGPWIAHLMGDAAMMSIAWYLLNNTK